jgi:predicted nucleotidyltransferase
MNEYGRSLLERENRRRDESLARSEEILVRLKRLIAEVAPSYPEIGTVSVFGSVARKTAAEESDIDLFVDHLDPEHFWKLMGLVSRELGRDVDIITEDDANKGFVSLVAPQGEVIYARQNPAP